jgi:hypothetical protein
MQLRTTRLLALLLLLPLSLGGCLLAAGVPLVAAGAGAASAGATPDTSRSLHRVGAALTIEFASPREIAGPVPGRGDSVRVAGVTLVTGRVEATRGDTMWLAVAELRSERRGRVPFGRGREPLLALPAMRRRSSVARWAPRSASSPSWSG